MKQCGLANADMSGWVANLGCGSGKKNRWMCHCSKIYKCAPHSIQVLILFKEMIVNWPTQDQLTIWEDYKTAYYKKFEPRGALMDVNGPQERAE